MFITYFALIIGALGAIVGIVIGIPRAAVSAKRINEILDSVPELQESENPEKPDENIKGSVEFRNVSFRYKPVDNEKKKSFRSNFRSRYPSHIAFYNGLSAVYGCLVFL